MTVLFLIGLVGFVGAQGTSPGTTEEAPYSKPYPIGQVTINLTEIGVGVGVQWGNGTLTYKGNQYTFKAKGLQIAAVGIKSATLTGDVYNMTDVGQFPGQYVGAGAGAAVGAGKEALVLQNQQGVRMRLNADQKGVSVSVGPEGFNVVMEKAL